MVSQTNSFRDGVILSGAAYSLQDFKQRTGLGRLALREARKAGLIVRRVGRRSFVLGVDFVRFLETAKVVSRDE